MDEDETIIPIGYDDLEFFNEYIKRFGFIDYPTIHFSREDWVNLNELAKTALENNKKIRKNELVKAFGSEPFDDDILI